MVETDAGSLAVDVEEDVSKVEEALKIKNLLQNKKI